MNHSLAACLCIFCSIFLTGCGRQEIEEEPYVVVTSDIHVSSEAGRLQQGNVLFQDFIKKIKSEAHKPAMIFIVGDIVDNGLAFRQGVVPGPLEHWRRDVKKYLEMGKELAGIPFVHAFGAGHDYGAANVTRDAAVALLGQKRGFVDWQDVRFIWFDISRGAFSTTERGHGENVLADHEMEWLATMIRTARHKVILLSHVPVRTPETLEAGIWFNGTNLTIPSADALYKLLYDNQEKILAIFNGHIHKAMTARLGSIPVYLCPLLPEGSYCTVTKSKNGSVAIEHRTVKEQ